MTTLNPSRQRPPEEVIATFPRTPIKDLTHRVPPPYIDGYTPSQLKKLNELAKEKKWLLETISVFGRLYVFDPTNKPEDMKEVFEQQDQQNEQPSKTRREKK
jgi:hypothetical protein